MFFSLSFSEVYVSISKLFHLSKLSTFVMLLKERMLANYEAKTPNPPILIGLICTNILLILFVNSLSLHKVQHIITSRIGSQKCFANISGTIYHSDMFQYEQ
jgi:hypothetical protein